MQRAALRVLAVNVMFAVWLGLESTDLVSSLRPVVASGAEVGVELGAHIGLTTGLLSRYCDQVIRGERNDTTSRLAIQNFFLSDLRKFFLPVIERRERRYRRRAGSDE